MTGERRQARATRVFPPCHAGPSDSRYTRPVSGTELLGGAIGIAMFAVGLASIVAWAVHGRRPDRTLLFFGLWCGLYGARLVFDQPAIVAILGGSERVAEYVRAFATYVINVPIGMFIESLIGPGWKASIRRLWQAQALYAVLAIAGDLARGEPFAMMPLNSPIVLVSLVVALANLWIYRGRLGPTFRTYAIAVGAVILLLFVTNENLRRPVVPSINIEPVGVFVFVMTLGYSVVARAFRQETELVAVQRELEMARRIQTQLLPRAVPRVHGLDVAARYVPMNAVAGDLYDFVTLDASRVGVLVVDVSGHGVPAALVASMVKLAFTTQVDHACDPARVLTAMNRIVCQNVDGTFVTAVYAVIDLERGVVSVANAGHPSLLVGRADGSVIRGVERGFMLGLTPDAPYASEEWEVRPGDRVLLYTDGLTEAQDPDGEFLDEERLAGWLASASGEASAVAELLLHNLRAWRGAAGFDDDVTFVVASLPAFEIRSLT
jgi:phosphoserine phosphatase RsbU/P